MAILSNKLTKGSPRIKTKKKKGRKRKCIEIAAKK